MLLLFSFSHHQQYVARLREKTSFTFPPSFHTRLLSLLHTYAYIHIYIYEKSVCIGLAFLSCSHLLWEKKREKKKVVKEL